MNSLLVFNSKSSTFAEDVQRSGMTTGSILSLITLMERNTDYLRSGIPTGS